MKRTLSVLIFLAVVVGMGFTADDKKAADKGKAELVASFEEDGDLDSWDFNAGAEAAIEAKHATEGKSAMKLTIPENSSTDKYAGFGCADQKFTSVFPEDWTPYSELLMDIFNESETPVAMRVKFKSDTHTKQFTKDVNIPKGKPYTLKIKTKDIKNVNLSAMMYMKMFIGQDLPVATVLYIDNIRLVKSDAGAK